METALDQGTQGAGATTGVIGSAAPRGDSAAERLRPGYAVGDRPCARCGFNLVGQPIVREPHYGLLLLRCPECGEAASVQEYPLLGRWANRLGVFLAACLVLAVILAFIGSVSATVGFADRLVSYSSMELGQVIGKRHAAWWEGLPQDEKDKITGGGSGWTPAQSGWQYAESGWWAELDKAALLREVGGRWRAIDWVPALIDAIWAVPAGGMLGLFWSLAVLGQSRRRVALVIPVVVLLSAGYIALERSQAAAWTWTWGGGRWEYTPYLAAALLVWNVVPLALAWMMGWMLVGVWLGRPVSRLLVRLMLPPRLRSGLSVLWTAEGKALPRPAPPRGP